MARSILQQVDGFTPVIDVVAQDVGFVTAAVYGVHWCYCQMRDGISRAAMKRIAERLGVSTKTARRHTRKLCERGYLEDLTPERRHAPHVYRDTGRVVIEGLLEARLDRGSTPTSGGLDRAARGVGPGDQPGATEGRSRMDRGSSEDSRKREERRRGKRPLSSLWRDVQGSLQGLMCSATYEAHFARGTPVALRGTTLVVALPNPRSIPAIQRLTGHITRAIEAQHGITLTFVAG